MVHSITPKAGLLSMMAAWVCHVPVRLHTFTGLVFPTATGLKRKILIFTDRLTCACATHIHPEGEGVKHDLIEAKITKKPLKVLGNGNIRGIDLAHFNPSLPEVTEEAEKLREKWIGKTSEKPFVFLFVGRLVRDKGVNELIAAFKEVSKKHPEAKLILVGPREDELDPLMPESIAEIESNPNIISVGFQADVRPWFAIADALVFPSYREGFPNVVIETGAMNLPSIVTDINGSREIIIEGENGVIIPPRDERALADAMLKFIESPEMVANMAAKARDLVASRYEQSFVRNCLIQYYHEICPNQPISEP